jgi:hypothetical protein
MVRTFLRFLGLIYLAAFVSFGWRPTDTALRALWLTGALRATPKGRPRKSPVIGSQGRIEDERPPAPWTVQTPTRA